jgi:Ca-activated chloride channel family protein
MAHAEFRRGTTLRRHGFATGMVSTRFPAVLVALALTVTAVAAAGATPRDGIYLVFDASNSMWGELPDKARKIEVARSVLGTFVAGDFADRDLALRIYGQNRPGDCADTSLVVPFTAAADAAVQIRAAVEATTPRGKTPITRSLVAALKDFGARKGDILLVSDGIETCDADPCELMREWRDSGVAIRVHVVGFGLDEVARSAMECVASTSGGKYFDAASAGELAGALGAARAAALSPAPAPGSEPQPPAAKDSFSLEIVASDGRGRSLPVEGTATAEDGSVVPVASHARNEISPGRHRLNVGVRTQAGQLFEPVTVEVAVTEPGETRVDVIVKAPASVAARFTAGGADGVADVDGGTVTAYRDGKESFRFRWFDEVFAEPGTWEFRSQPNADNALSVTATLRAGELTTVSFVLTQTVHVGVGFQLPSGAEVKRNSELWQAGAKRYSVHSRNGATVQPGAYEVRSADGFTPVQGHSIEVTGEARQSFEVPLRAGFLEVSYAPEATYRKRPDRAFVESESGAVAGGHLRLGEPIAILPGEYVVQGWTQAGEFAPVPVVVRENETSMVVLAPVVRPERKEP